MAERQTVTQRQQIGVEATPGTDVPATRRLGSMSINMGVASESSMFRPRGTKFATVQALNQEWTEGDLEGQPTYDEVIYPLAGAVGAPVTSQIMDAATPTGAYQHVFTPSSSELDSPKTFTLEQGDATQAEQITHLLITAFGLDVSRSEVSLSGSAFGRSVEKGITLTPGLAIPSGQVPILPGQFCVYTADTAAELSDPGATHLTRVISVNPSIGDRYNPAWFVNCQEPSFTTWTENPEGPTSENAMTLEADAVGMGLLDRLRDGATVYFRLVATGPEIMAGVPESAYKFQWDMAVKAREVDTWSDEDGIWAIPYTFQVVHDETWNKSQVITVVNSRATL
jgi:hypothetical protein